jgi:hypothetical protein
MSAGSRLFSSRNRAAATFRCPGECSAREDALTYVEPSDWYVPPRHNLGAALLTLGRAPNAEAVDRKDLEFYPANGWSLAGLAQSLRAQGKTAEAEQVRWQLAQVWVGDADALATSRL